MAWMSPPDGIAMRQGGAVCASHERRGHPLHTLMLTFKLRGQLSMEKIAPSNPGIKQLGCSSALTEKARTMGASSEQVAAGQVVYTKRILGVYNLVALGVHANLFWKCPRQRIVEHYNRHVTANHLDVGVGTGYFLDHCRFPSPAPRVALMDINRNPLDFAARHLARYKPETYLRNVLEPISIDAAKFDSVGVNYLLHCLPGSIETKSVALDHLESLMNPGGVLFGATLLQGGVTRNWAAKRLMDRYNRKGIFSNKHDDVDGLKRTLGQRFRSVSVEIIGCVALFSGCA